MFNVGISAAPRELSAINPSPPAEAMGAGDKMVKSLKVAIHTDCCWPVGMPVNLQHCISSVLAQTLAPIRTTLRQNLEDKADRCGVRWSLRQDVEHMLMGYDQEVGQFRADLGALEALVAQLRKGHGEPPSFRGGR